MEADKMHGLIAREFGHVVRRLKCIQCLNLIKKGK